MDPFFEGKHTLTELIENLKPFEKFIQQLNFPANFVFIDNRKESWNKNHKDKSLLYAGILDIICLVLGF